RHAQICGHGFALVLAQLGSDVIHLSEGHCAQNMRDCESFQVFAGRHAGIARIVAGSASLLADGLSGNGCALQRPTKNAERQRHGRKSGTHAHHSILDTVKPVPAVLLGSSLFLAVLASRLCHVNLLWADEDYHLAAAIQTLHGKLPYRDFWYDKPPLNL